MKSNKSLLKVKKYKINNNLNKIYNKLKMNFIKPISHNINLALKRKLHTIRPLKKFDNKDLLKKKYILI